MEKEIYLKKEAIGRAVLSMLGGHMQIDAVIPYMDGIWRLYITEDDQFDNLGVLMPESGSLTLHRRVSLPALGIRPERAVLRLMSGTQTPKPEEPEEKAAPEEDAAPEEEDRPEACESPPAGMLDRWCACSEPAALTHDELLSRILSRIDGALYRYRAGSVELAIPAGHAEEISAVLCLTRAEEIRDGEYFVLSLDGAGLPAPAMPSSRY